MGYAHIYTATSQPATSFKDFTFEPPMECGFKPRQLLWCESCGKRHRAENMSVQCFYDGWRTWCASGKGCKDPAKLQADERRRFRNRSKGQKRRWSSPPHRLTIGESE